MAWTRMLVRELHWQSSLRKRTKASPLQERKMVDKMLLRVRGGQGGNGSCSMLRSLSSRFGHVDGGSGGVGGNVILRSTNQLFDFSNLRHLVVAADGGSGMSKKMFGKRGVDQVVLVPLGTVVHLCDGDIPASGRLCRSAKRLRTTEKNWIKIRSTDEPASESENEQCTAEQDELDEDDEDGEQEDLTDESDTEAAGEQSDAESEEQDDAGEEDFEDEEDFSDDDPLKKKLSRTVKKSNIAELLYPNDTLMVALGGAGGRGNSVMPKTMVGKGGRTFAQPKSEPGFPGTEAMLLLELKSIADIGLVGAPNVGKSTLLGAISKAKPNVGDYAFTTLRPNIGRVDYVDFFALSVADIPGLITGAHEDKGLGFDFLRHVERTKVFAYVLDCSLGIGDRKGSPAWLQLEELMYEMECYRAGMTNRPSLVIANKVDEDGAEGIVKELRRRVKLPVYPTCAVLGEGIPELKEGLRLVLDEAAVDAPDLQDL